MAKGRPAPTVATSKYVDEPWFTTLDLPVTEAEFDALAAMMAAGAFPTPRALLRSALTNYARHLGVDLPHDIFAIATRANKTRA